MVGEAEALYANTACAASRYAEGEAGSSVMQGRIANAPATRATTSSADYLSGRAQQGGSPEA